MLEASWVSRSTQTGSSSKNFGEAAAPDIVSEAATASPPRTAVSVRERVVGFILGSFQAGDEPRSLTYATCGPETRSGLRTTEDLRLSAQGSACGALAEAVSLKP